MYICIYIYICIIYILKLMLIFVMILIFICSQYSCTNIHTYFLKVCSSFRNPNDFTFSFFRCPASARGVPQSPLGAPQFFIHVFLYPTSTKGTPQIKEASICKYRFGSCVSGNTLFGVCALASHIMSYVRTHAQICVAILCQRKIETRSVQFVSRI